MLTIMPVADPSLIFDASNITITVVDDDIPEGPESFNVTAELMSTSFTGLSTPDPITVEILDNHGIRHN